MCQAQLSLGLAKLMFRPIPSDIPPSSDPHPLKLGTHPLIPPFPPQTSSSEIPHLGPSLEPTPPQLLVKGMVGFWTEG